jgi:hypothetical protein
MQRLQVSVEARGYALLRGIADQIITGGAPEALLIDASDLQQVHQLLARQARDETRSLYYAYPVVSQQRSLIPVCYVQVILEPEPASGGIRIRRDGDLLINRLFLLEDGDLTDREVADFARGLRTGGAMDGRLRDLLGDGVITPHGLLFRADPDLMTRSLLRELDKLERQAVLSAPLNAFIQDDPPALASAPTPGLTVVRSNPAQNKVLRQRASVLQVVAGPPGTGKTQTIINLIASAIADGQTVLFISRNNTAVDNVYDAFLDEGLFPGILRLGSREVRQRSSAAFRKVLTGLKKGMPAPEDKAAFEAKGMALTRQIARLEEERAEIERLQATAAEMTLLLRRTDEALQESGLYRYATDLAGQVTPETASEFEPQQMIGLRRLEAITAGWQDPPATFWGRLLERLGILERRRLRRLGQELAGLRLPALCAISGQTLHQRLEALLRLSAVFPFLLATARHTRATAELAGKRPLDAIRADLDQAYTAKMDHDRRLLTRRWAELVNDAQPRLAQLQELIPLFERMAAGSTDPSAWREWWRRYEEVLSIFPVICSTNLSLAGAAPNEPERFDLVILDEASQSDIASFLPALYRARRACVVGDAMQLSHISQLDAADDERLRAAAAIRPVDALSYHQNSAFDRAMAVAGRSTYTLLDRHYRCVPEIIGFCNQHFYEGKLKLERQAAPGQPLPGDLPARGFLLDAIEAGKTEYRRIAAGNSASNAAEAERVIHLVQQYIEAGLTDIGVVTPFRAQRELLERRLREIIQAEPDEARRQALREVEVGTIHTFQGGQHRLMLFSTVVAPGAREGTVRWFEENRNLLNVAISRARDLLIVVGHRGTLTQAGGILAAMVEYADGLARPGGALPPLPPGLQPERLGLLPSEAEILRSWVKLPEAAVAEVLNQGEQVLYRELLARVQGRRAMLAPKMRVLDCIELGRLAGLTQQERDYAFRAHFDVVVVDQESFRPVAAVELDGRQHETDPLTQARDRLKDSLCGKVGLRLVRVKWGDWGQLATLDAVLDTKD